MQAISWLSLDIVAYTLISYNSGLLQIVAQFQVSQEVALLGLVLFLLGYGMPIHHAMFQLSADVL